MRGHFAQRLVGQHEGRVAGVAGLVHDVGIEDAGQHLHGEDFLHRPLEAQKRHGAPVADVDDPHAAGALLQLIDERDVAEDCALADLREADECEVAVEVYAAREAGQPGDAGRAAGPRIDDGDGADAGFQNPKTPRVEARRVRHAKARADCLAALDIEEEAAAGFVLPPAAGRVRPAEAGHVFHAVADDGHAVQVAAILRRVGGDEIGTPARDEAVLPIKSAEAGEARVHRPDLRADPADLVDADVAAVMAPAREEGGVVRARGQELRRDIGLVAEFPDLRPRADGEPAGLRLIRDAHRAVEVAEVGVELAALGAQHDEPAGLVGGDEQRDAEFAQDRGEIARVAAGEGWRFLGVHRAGRH